MKVKNVLIFANSKNKETIKEAKEISDFLQAKKIKSSLVELFANSTDVLPDGKFDLAISLGGDGTVLTAARLIENTKMPIIAVNMGTFGYITETPLSEFKDVFEDFFEGRTGVQERLRLDTKIIHNGKTIVMTALNDICVGAMSHSRLAKISLEINGTEASNLKCDGVIVSTPTGSTAYNLSAGGPIVLASVSSIVINPICPFTLGARPLVVADSDVIKLTVPEQKAHLELTVDGKVVCEIQSGDVLEIKKSRNKTFFVENKRRNNIEILRDKLGWAGGFNA